MSQMEYNKGKLTLSSFEEVLSIYPDATIEDLAWETNEEFEYINNKVFRVEFKSRSEDLDEINNLEVNPDGSLSFETYHYNGGAHWTELVEAKLKDKGL